MNGFGKICGRTDRDGRVIDFYLYLAAMFVRTGSARGSRPPDGAGGSSHARSPCVQADHERPWVRVRGSADERAGPNTFAASPLP
jgi:hypothetical protein